MGDLLNMFRAKHKKIDDLYCSGVIDNASATRLMNSLFDEVEAEGRRLLDEAQKLNDARNLCPEDILTIAGIKNGHH